MRNILLGVLIVILIGCSDRTTEKAAGPPAVPVRLCTDAEILAGTLTAPCAVSPAGIAATYPSSGSSPTFVDGNFTGAVTIGTTLAWKNPGTIVVDGDSRAARNNTSDDNEKLDTGWLNWANIFLGQRLTVVADVANSGDKTSDILAGIPAALEYGAQYHFAQGGINDVITGVSAATITANLAAIYAAIYAGGSIPIAATIAPADAIDTSAERQVYFDVNKWIRSYCKTQGIIVIDFVGPVIDGDNSYPNPLPGMTNDGTHQTNLGAIVLGKAIYNRLYQVFPEVDNFSNSNADPNVLNANPMQIGTSGTASTGASGTFADGWAAQATNSGTVVGSKVARTDGIDGEWQQLVISATTTGTTDCRYYSLIPSGPSYIGDTIKIAVEADYGSSAIPNLYGIQIRVDALNSSWVSIDASYGIKYASTATDTEITTGIGYGVYTSGAFTVPASTAYLYIYIDSYFEGVGSGTIKVGRAEAILVEDN